jgi:hypothetical protein
MGSPTRVFPSRFLPGDGFGCCAMALLAMRLSPISSWLPGAGRWAISGGLARC